MVTIQFPWRSCVPMQSWSRSPKSLCAVINICHYHLGNGKFWFLLTYPIHQPNFCLFFCSSPSFSLSLITFSDRMPIHEDVIMPKINYRTRKSVLCSLLLRIYYIQFEQHVELHTVVMALRVYLFPQPCLGPGPDDNPKVISPAPLRPQQRWTPALQSPVLPGHGIQPAGPSHCPTHQSWILRASTGAGNGDRPCLATPDRLPPCTQCSSSHRHAGPHGSLTAFPYI